MKKRLIGLLLAFAFIFMAGCSNVQKKTYNYIIRPEPVVNKTDYTDYNVLPAPTGDVQKEIQYINMEGRSWNDLMLATSLQGNVNRVDPSMYILKQYIVEGSPALNASEYWFDKLDESYTEDGKPYFNKKQYTDIFQMVYDNREDLSGVVLYHERLADAQMGGKGIYGSIYSDVALLNLTIMMCAAENAVAVTDTQYFRLKEMFEKNGETMLEIKGDTTKFMESTPESQFGPRNSAAVWKRVYEYALTKYADDFSDKAVAHNPGFQAAQFDYYIQNKIFVYNRSLSTGVPGGASEDENNIEKAILGVSDYNTPILGVWYLHLDEANYVNFLTGLGKFFIVSYESFNWSWTRGLPEEKLETGEDMDIELEEGKIYLAFSFTEGDNNSYVHFKLPQLFDSEYTGKYPFSWTIAPTAFETNPDIIKYLNANWHEGDGLCIPEAGVDYVDPAPPANTSADFFALTDEYVRRVGNANIRTLQHNLVDALSYAEGMEELDSLLCGYGIGISNNYNYNTGASDFLFRDVPYLNQYDGRLVYENFKDIEDTDTRFFSISYSGWEHSLEDMCDLMDTLDERFVVVTQKQLAKLYRDHYLGKIIGVDSVSFKPNMSREEMAYLYKASLYSNFDGNEKYRYADGKNYFTYRVRMNKSAESAELGLALSGNYSVEMSTDYNKWYKVADGSESNIAQKKISVPSFLMGKDDLYVRFGDRTENDGGGVKLYAFDLQTNLAKTESVTVDTKHDALYAAGKTGELTAAGRKGEFVYKFNMADGITAADVVIGLSSETQTATLGVSKDGKSFTNTTLKKYGSSMYGALSGISGTLYLKVNSSEAVTAVRIARPQAKGGSFNFRPLGNGVEKKYMLSLDGSDQIITSDAASQSKSIENGQAMLYRFDFKDTVTSAKLRMEITGHYKISVSNDNATYTDLKSVGLDGEVNELTQEFDISSHIASSKTLYLKIEKSLESVSRVQLRRLRITTNVNDDYLDDKIRLENSPNPIIRPRTNEESAIIDETLSSNYAYYLDSSGYTTKIDAVKDGKLVYKLDFNTSNAAFWSSLGLDIVNYRLENLSLILTVCNSYKLEISANGTDWTVFAEETDLVTGGSNKENIRIDATDYLTNSTVYIRMSRGESWNGSHEALLYSMRFAFVVAAI